MKTIKYLVFMTLMPLCTATAGDKGEQDAWMREAIAKERGRAEESMKNFGNAERLNEKFGWMKEKHPDHVAAVMAANKKAAEAWGAVLRKAEGATNPDELAEAKQAANSATADAYLAEMTLKYAGSAADRKNMMEKTRDRDVAALIAKLDTNEKSLLLANKAKNDAQTNVEKLQNENRNLNNELRKTYDQARKKDEGDRCDKDRDKERHEKERREKEKDHRPDDGDGGGGGVLGR